MQTEPRKKVYGIPTFYGVYEDYKDLVMTYGGRSWNSDTVAQYNAIVLTYILPYLKDHDLKHIGQYSRQDLHDAFCDFKKQGRNGPGNALVAWGHEGVPEKVDYLIRAVVWAGSQMMLCKDLFAADLTSRAGGTYKESLEQLRTPKSFTIKQEKDISNYLMDNLYAFGSVAGLLLMYALGLRNNEACGANFGYIREFSEYPGHYYLIVPQSTELGANTLKILGKTANSGRKIPMPELLVQILLRLQNHRYRLAKEKGYAGKPDDLPIACKKNKPWERCSADDLTHAAKDMFIHIGMRHDQLIKLSQELLEDAQAAEDELEGDAFREIESDPTAYLLRRNFATHIAILGLREVEIWYIIGHKIEDEYVQRRAFNDEKLLFAIKQKMDERPILNPILLEKVHRVGSGNYIKLDGSAKNVIEIPMNRVSDVRICADAREPGDAIHIKVTVDAEQGSVESSLLTYAAQEPVSKHKTIDGIRLYHKRFHEGVGENQKMKQEIEE